MILVGIAIALFYLLVGVAGCAIAERAMFPAPTPSYRDSAAIRRLAMPDGSEIATVFIKNPASPYVLLYSHGNGEDLGYILPLLEEYGKQGFNVMAYDYPGYGTSDGTPTTAGTKDAIMTCYTYLVEERGFPPERIILLGRSIGAGPSTWLAAREPVGGLILESAFTSVLRVITRYRIYPYDYFNNLRELPNVRCPVLVVHGTDDRIVDFWHGEKLLANVPGESMFLWVPGAGHNNLVQTAGSIYWETIKKFSEQVYTP